VRGIRRVPARLRQVMDFVGEPRYGEEAALNGCSGTAGRCERRAPKQTAIGLVKPQSTRLVATNTAYRSNGRRKPTGLQRTHGPTRCGARKPHEWRRSSATVK